MVSVDAASLVVARHEEVLRLELGEDAAGAGVAEQLRQIVRQRVRDARAQEELAARGVCCSRISRAGSRRPRSSPANRSMNGPGPARARARSRRGAARPPSPPSACRTSTWSKPRPAARAARRTLSCEREVSRTDLRQAPLEAETVQPEGRRGSRRRTDRARRVMQQLELAKDDRARAPGRRRARGSPGRSLAEPLNEPNDRVVGGRVGRQRADPLERELHPEPELWLQLSSRSTVSQATSSRPAAHAASSTVFPVPAWAGATSPALDAARHELEQPRTLDVPLR